MHGFLTGRLPRGAMTPPRIRATRIRGWPGPPRNQPEAKTGAVGPCIQAALRDPGMVNELGSQIPGRQGRRYRRRLLTRRMMRVQEAPWFGRRWVTASVGKVGGDGISIFVRPPSQVTCGDKEGQMDKVTRYEWHGNWLLLTLQGLLVITIPIGIVYFLTHILKIETQVPDGAKLSEFLRSRK